MINLLPPIEKLHLQKDKRMRLTAVYFLLFSIATTIGIVLLLPAYFLADIREAETQQEIESILNSTESNEREEVNNELQLTKVRLRALTATEDKQELFTVIDEMANETGSTIRLSQISYSRGDEGEPSIFNVKGFADTRNDLLRFTRSLEASELFTDVDLPVSSLAKDIDIEFTITTKGAF